MNRTDKYLLKHGFDANGNRIRVAPKPKKPTYGQRRLRERMQKSMGLMEARRVADRSPMEKEIGEFLMRNGIRFVAEHSAKYCYSRKTNHVLFFDFWIPDYNAVIEFDGIHHFKAIYGEEKLKQQKYKDSVKNRYCGKKGIHMLRIPCFVSKDYQAIICRFFDKHEP